MGIMIFMLKSQRRAFRWPNNLRARLYIIQILYIIHFIIYNYICACQFEITFTLSLLIFSKILNISAINLFIYYYYFRFIFFSFNFYTWGLELMG